MSVNVFRAVNAKITKIIQNKSRYNKIFKNSNKYQTYGYT